jgi:5-methylcytosine-specific restriction protein A
MALCGRYALANGFCKEHQRDQRAQSAAVEGVNVSRSSARFRRLRHSYLVRHPMCAMCKREPATILDHIVPHRGMPHLYWDYTTNWQGLCVTCHGIKTARETLR